MKDPEMDGEGPRDRPRRVLVTGGAGFIGSHVAEGYLARGDEVWILDDLSSGRESNVPDGANFVRMEIQDPGVRELFEEHRFDLVNHHAAQIDVRVSVDDPQRDAQTNVMGLLNLLESARHTQVGRFVYISSGGVVYGEPEQIPTPETSPKLPLSPYGVSKLTGEQYLYYYRQVHGLEYVALRYGNVYGPRQDPHGEAGVVAIFSSRLLDQEEITIFGDGEQTRDYVYVGDVARANMRASSMELAEGPGLDVRGFNVATGVATSVNRLADLLEEVSGVRTSRSFGSPRKGELRHSALDVSRFATKGWAPAHSLRDGLRETFEWIAGQTARRGV